MIEEKRDVSRTGKLGGHGLLSRLDPATRAEVDCLISQRVEEETRCATALAVRNLDLAQEGGRIGIFDINLATGDASGSAIWAGLLGQARGERTISRRAWMKLLHPDDCNRVLAGAAEMARSGADTAVEYRIVLQSGEVRWLYSRNLVVPAVADVATAYGMLQDITERKHLQANVLHAAYHDALTGIPNRRFFMERLTTACQGASQQRAVGLAIYDLDFLKKANDQHGHDAGDVLLKATADRLQDACGKDALVARLGGDEFARLLETEDLSQLRIVAKKALGMLCKPVRFQGTLLDASASAGGALSSRLTMASEMLFRRADQALLHAKRGGRGAYQEYHSQLST